MDNLALIILNTLILVMLWEFRWRLTSLQRRLDDLRVLLESIHHRIVVVAGGGIGSSGFRQTPPEELPLDELPGVPLKGKPTDGQE